MDTFPEDGAPDAFPALSYDDTAYEEQLPTPAEQASLARRIGTTKVYLLSETVATRVGGKRKHGDEDAMDDEDVDMDQGNALLLQGIAYSQPTHRSFICIRDALWKPTRWGLEWVDDERCAQAAYKSLQKHIAEEPDAEGVHHRKSTIPVAIWPPEERINNSLGKGQGLKGTIRMRWAKVDDVKKKGAKKDSQFYKKHTDGRLGRNHTTIPHLLGRPSAGAEGAQDRMMN
ncbi:hypothetical protein MVEN_02420800 [Mycena venus]|uniref:Uncharacterized protein n=1 Tax=Mycena venus TaxID=2733690 RepID=A0A8H6WY60_9AGAR|nr:hypothetical protein MVEN_02420800 [Mycena venus]